MCNIARACLSMRGDERIVFVVVVCMGSVRGGGHSCRYGVAPPVGTHVHKNHSFRQGAATGTTGNRCDSCPTMAAVSSWGLAARFLARWWPKLSREIQLRKVWGSIFQESHPHTLGGGRGGRGGESRTCPKKISKSHLADKKEPGCLKNDRLTRSV